MKKQNLNKLKFNKKMVSKLNDANRIVGGKEKSIHETNCNQCPPTESNACPTEGCPAPTEEGTCGLLCSLNITCYINL